MKKIISFILALWLLLIFNTPVSAQAVKTNFSSYSLTTDELIERVCRIESTTLVGGINFLAVVTCFRSDDSRSGFYFKDNGRWYLVPTDNFGTRNCLPDDIFDYKDAVAANKVSGSIVGTYNLDKLIVLMYEDENGCELFDVFDLISRKVVKIIP